MTTDQTIITTCAVIAGARVDNCKECGGSGLSKDQSVACPHCRNDVVVSLEMAQDIIYCPIDWCEEMFEISHDLEPCPTCTPIRELDLCWHEPDGMTWICGNCKTDVGWRGNNEDSVDVLTLNPDLTTAMHGPIPLIVHYLQVLGIWGEFLQYVGTSTIIKKTEPSKAIQGLDVTIFDYANMQINFAEILINGELRRNAIASFLAGRG